MKNQPMKEQILAERFVEVLSMETQSGEIQWHFERGYGSPALCICEGRELILTPNSEQGAYTLCSMGAEGNDSCLLMGCKGASDVPNQLHDLYQDIAESISVRSSEPAIIQMQVFMRKSAERQCLYSIMDAVKLLCQNMASIMRDID